MYGEMERAIRQRKVPVVWGTVSLTVLLTALIWPAEFLGVSQYVLTNLLIVAPLVIPGIVLAAWITASGADLRIAGVLHGHAPFAILASAAIGALTPVCGIAVLPLLAGLLAAGVPLAPIMAFWVSSPVTDPAMFATTAATLGAGFAIGKTLAAFGLGIFGGLVTLVFGRALWAKRPLRESGLLGDLPANRCNQQTSVDPFFWRSTERRMSFFASLKVTSRLILICLIPAFAAEYVLSAALKPDALSGFLGAESRWAIPFAVLVGAPAYIDGYAALPLTRSLIDHGLSKGAAMGFLVSGGVVSIWGALAIFPVLKIKPFLLYMIIALSGSLAAGFLYQWLG